MVNHCTNYQTYCWNYVICHSCLSMFGYLFGYLETVPRVWTLWNRVPVTVSGGRLYNSCSQNLEWPDSSVVRAFGIYPEGPGFKFLSGYFCQELVRDPDPAPRHSEQHPQNLRNTHTPRYAVPLFPSPLFIPSPCLHPFPLSPITGTVPTVRRTVPTPFHYRNTITVSLWHCLNRIIILTQYIYP